MKCRKIGPTGPTGEQGITGPQGVAGLGYQLIQSDKFSAIIPIAEEQIYYVPSNAVLLHVRLWGAGGGGGGASTLEFSTQFATSVGGGGGAGGYAEMYIRNPESSYAFFLAVGGNGGIGGTNGSNALTSTFGTGHLFVEGGMGGSWVNSIDSNSTPVTADGGTGGSGGGSMITETITSKGGSGQIGVISRLSIYGGQGGINRVGSGNTTNYCRNGTVENGFPGQCYGQGGNGVSSMIEGIEANGGKGSDAFLWVDVYGFV